MIYVSIWFNLLEEFFIKPILLRSSHWTWKLKMFWINKKYFCKKPQSFLHAKMFWAGKSKDSFKTIFFLYTEGDNMAYLYTRDKFNWDEGTYTRLVGAMAGGVSFFLSSFCILKAVKFTAGQWPLYWDSGPRMCSYYILLYYKLVYIQPKSLNKYPTFSSYHYLTTIWYLHENDEIKDWFWGRYFLSISRQQLWAWNRQRILHRNRKPQSFISC